MEAAAARRGGLGGGRVRPTLADWQQPEHLAWSFRHVRELIPTARVARGGTPSPLPRREDAGELPGVSELMETHFTDGLLVLHEGEVVLEAYGRGMRADDTHLLQSVSKSITGTLTGVLAARGALEPEDQVVEHVPELAGTSFDGATVRDLLDMRAGTRFDETYDDPDSDIRASEAQFGWAPEPPPAPDALAYLAALGTEREHGGRFEYRSILTDVLGLVLERAGGAPFAELLGRELWAPMGAEFDADVTVDRGGFAVADGGICVTLRDLGRFGQLVLDEGRSVVPASWIADAREGGEDSGAAFAQDEHAADLPGGHYRSQWWVPAGGRVLLGLGIHGQFLYVDRAARVVIAKLSTWPTPLDDELRAATLATFATIADHLSEGASP
jgi:CubicO group peptidase (beta-lactamase class C family)